MANTSSYTSVAAKAFLRDKRNNEYTGDALLLAIILHCSGGDRSTENENEIAEMFDDLNIKSDKRK